MLKTEALMRTVKDIAARAKQLDPKHHDFKVVMVKSLGKNHAEIWPMLRILRITSFYLDDTKASDKAVDAMLHHELGHYYDLTIPALIVLFVVSALATVYLSTVFALGISAVLLFRIFGDPFLERRADRWAEARMPDYWQHKIRKDPATAHNKHT